MLAPALILWGDAERIRGPLLQNLAPHGLAVREIRSTRHCLAAVRVHRGSAVVVRVDDNAEPALGLIDAVRRLDSSALVVVHGPRGSRGLEPLARELGAAHFETDPVAVEPLAELLLRHLRRSAIPKNGKGTSDAAARIA